MERLNDLEAITHQVRTPRSRDNIHEAINAYYGGAYRSAIVSTWIAVADDIIEKIKELAAYDDPLAKQLADDLHKNVSQRKIPWLQKFEEDLLERALNDFEFIGTEQKTNLDRIKQDRNHCAHPAYTQSGALFNPAPELARTHIIHAITDLLQHAPVRGKSSTKIIVEDIMGEGFPATTPSAAGAFLNTKYLEYAKASLTSNLLNLLVKAVLKRLPDWQGNYDRAVLALLGIAEVKSEVFDQWMRENFERITSQLSGKDVYRLFGLVVADIRYWDWMGQAQRIQLIEFFSKKKLPSAKQPASYEDKEGYSFAQALSDIFGAMTSIKQGEFLEELGIHKLSDLFVLMRVGDLKEPLMNVFSTLSSDDKLDVISERPAPFFMQEALELYAKASSFRGAEHLGQNILPPLARYMSKEDIINFQNIILENGQVYAASGTCGILMDWIDELQKRDDIDLKAQLDWTQFCNDLTEQYDNYAPFKSHLIETGILKA